MRIPILILSTMYRKEVNPKMKTVNVQETIKLFDIENIEQMQDVQFQEQITRTIVDEIGTKIDPIDWKLIIAPNRIVADLMVTKAKLDPTLLRGQRNFAIIINETVDPDETATQLYDEMVAKLTRYKELDEHVHCTTVKSKHVGCKQCTSKVAREYITTNFCPVCNHDFRPESTLNRIESAKNALRNANQKYEDYITGKDSKPGLFVFVEYIVKS